MKDDTPAIAAVAVTKSRWNTVYLLESSRRHERWPYQKIWTHTLNTHIIFNFAITFADIRTYFYACASSLRYDL